MILDDFRLDGKVALVTGGSRGIGGAIVLALAEAGADVVAVSRKPEPELAEVLAGTGKKFFHYLADLTQRQETKDVIPAALEKMGRLDILVNNAGICPRAPVLDFPEEDWDATLEINLTAPLLLSQAAARVMIPKKAGKIINIASILSYQGGINIPAYAATKHGLAGLTKACSNAWAGAGVNVNAIAPGYLKTEMTQALQNDPERAPVILKRTPAGRWGIPNDIAGAAVFLASQASDFMHGAVIPIDGGWLGW
ncbi:MAG TPA: SDR family oxidoreductase [Thermodesulfobacteriota bacterium]|nr:SDR family oxidoreductase [Thermodesulfobacteriota bacterium]